MPTEPKFTSFAAFYPFYLSQHQHPGCMWLHRIGLLLAITTLISALIQQRFLMALLSPVIGYSCSWVGHFFFEKNKPATLNYPFYSLRGDFKMTVDWIVNNS